jgi:hypothetical protein
MNERFADRMKDPNVAHDTRLLGDFAVIYCTGKHKGAARAPLGSDGARLGVYRKVPVVCEECAELLAYAEKRRAFCPKDPKPFCSYCDTHCYNREARDLMRDVMRYAGPRSIVHGHAIDAVRHAFAARQAKAQARSAETTNKEPSAS